MRPEKFASVQAQRLPGSDDYSCRPFDEHRCIFVHVPKCAGISISKSLFGNLAGAHQSLRKYQIMFSPAEFASYFKFTFVRNPWDRLVSAYFFLKNGGITASDKAWSQRHLQQHDTFDSFVRNGITRREILKFPHFRPQTSFICLRPGLPGVDFIGFFENLAADFEIVRSRLQLQASLQNLNRTASRDKNFADCYSNETRAIVARVYQDDLAVLGYTFDNSTLPAMLARRDAGKRR
ncbi:MAG TPA: sulfotransferase family 2 domain-containing protein [Verrucomicrobiae bacterium]|nr:sulfotransferase family 2 domain-containing protein [Verrucomicrobiae bacterium]